MAVLNGPLSYSEAVVRIVVKVAVLLLRLLRLRRVLRLARVQRSLLSLLLARLLLTVGRRRGCRCLLSLLILLLQRSRLSIRGRDDLVVIGLGVVLRADIALAGLASGARARVFSKMGGNKLCIGSNAALLTPLLLTPRLLPPDCLRPWRRRCPRPLSSRAPLWTAACCHPIWRVASSKPLPLTALPLQLETNGLRSHPSAGQATIAQDTVARYVAT